MSEHRVAGRYAKSLIDLSREQKNLDQIYKDIVVFKQLLETNAELQNLLKSPIINGDKKLAVLKQIFSASFHKNTIAFFDIIIRKKREYYLGAVANAFVQQYNDLNRIISASVRTAIKIDDKTTAEIKAFIEKATGKNVQLKNSVDEDLIGGMVIQMEDKLYDASVAGKLNKAKKELLNTYISN